MSILFAIQIIPRVFGSAVLYYSIKEIKNLDMWHDSLSAKQKRILGTRWTREAWRKLCSDKIFAKKLFMKTVCLMTADQWLDDQTSGASQEPYSF